MTQPAGAPTAESPPGTVVAAAILLAIRVTLALWLALVVAAATKTHHRRFMRTVIRQHHPGLALLLAVWVVAGIAAVIGLLTLQRWARPTAFVLEGIAVVGAIVRLGARPGLALVSMLFSALVVGLLLSRSSQAALRR